MKLASLSDVNVYGDQVSPLHELMDLKVTNPYDETKKMSECILKDFSRNNKDMNITLLRYFILLEHISLV